MQNYYLKHKKNMKSFHKILTIALTIISSLGNNSVSASPTNQHIDLIEPGLILNEPIGGATDCSNAFQIGTLSEIIGCIQLGIGPAVEQNHNNISTNSSAIETLQGSSSSADITANTNKINTNTSNINSLGEGVAGSTALTAALSALPQMSKESKTTCGVGTGAYSSRYAVGFGCASKVSKRIDVNAGGSYVFGGSKSYGGGTLDSGVVKAGFVFKLGELNKPTQISLNESNVLKNEVKDLKAKNNQLLSRLEKLENIASKFLSSSEMISVATKD